ncbi:MAG: hypothetical protein LC778_16085 [Acidobacteria bacterium]|nr:hypothetical protein [Acidobacteriota bacterium]
MSENTVVITEKDGKYHIKNNGISEFALLGILECIVFEMKTAKRQELSSKGESSGDAHEAVKETAPIAATPKSNAPELRTRINNAVKAIKSLGGEVTDFAADTATDEELQE